MTIWWSAMMAYVSTKTNNGQCFKHDDIIKESGLDSVWIRTVHWFSVWCPNLNTIQTTFFCYIIMLETSAIVCFCWNISHHCISSDGHCFSQNTNGRYFKHDEIPFLDSLLARFRLIILLLITITLYVCIYVCLYLSIYLSIYVCTDGNN